LLKNISEHTVYFLYVHKREHVFATL